MQRRCVSLLYLCIVAMHIHKANMVAKVSSGSDKSCVIPFGARLSVRLYDRPGWLPPVALHHLLNAVKTPIRTRKQHQYRQ